mgnify:CR=1 FL=1
MTNGYVYALIDSDGEIKATYRYKYETNKARKLKGQAIVMLKELFYKALENDSWYFYPRICPVLCFIQIQVIVYTRPYESLPLIWTS